MINPKSVLMLLGREQQKNISAEIDNDIIDDTALVDRMNALNFLRESEQFLKQRAQQNTLLMVEQINAEMKWYSQWSAVAAKSAA